MIKNIEDFHQKLSHNSEEDIWNLSLNGVQKFSSKVTDVWKKNTK